MGNLCADGDRGELPPDVVHNHVPHTEAERAEFTKDWDKDLPPMTTAELERKREEFWETRIEGRKEMWQAIKMAAETEEADTSRAILECAGLSPYDIDKPGSSYFCYDQRGTRYEVPLYILFQPGNLVKGQVPIVHPLPEGKDDIVQFTVRFSNYRHDDIIVELLRCESILDLKKLIDEQTQIHPSRQRIIYSGRQLKDEQTLLTAAVAPLTVVQIFVQKGTGNAG